MRKDVLQRISKLESVDVSKTELNVCIDNKFSETKDFSAKMEGISETRLLSLLSRQCPVIDGQERRGNTNR